MHLVYSSCVSSSGTNPERLAKENQQLRNRNTYLEAQVDEMRGKLNEAEADLAKRVEEVGDMFLVSFRFHRWLLN